MTASRKSVQHPRVGLHVEIFRLLRDRALTAIDLAAMLGKQQAGIDSALRGMERRGEIVRMPYRLGVWAKWTLGVSHDPSRQHRARVGTRAAVAQQGPIAECPRALGSQSQQGIPRENRSVDISPACWMA